MPSAIQAKYDNPPQPRTKKNVSGSLLNFTRSPAVAMDSRPYWLSVTLEVIQGQCFSCHLKANMRLPINDQ